MVDFTRTSVGLIPLTDLGTGTYHGFQGGLYPGGTNEPPAAYRQIGLARARAVQPLNQDGVPAADGTIVLLGIGFSNTTQEFSAFKQEADRDPRKNPRLVIVDGAQGGQDALTISNPDANYWKVVDQRILNAGVSDAQVQVVWFKEVIPRRQFLGSFPEDARHLQRTFAADIALLARRYPNLQLIYAASRTYGGYSTSNVSPEPYSYHNGFAVKWLIAEAINGAMGRPWLAWGPYLWTDGAKGRIDGLTWTPEDLRPDGLHPSVSGCRKTTALLLRFLKSDETAKGWFVAQ